MYCTARARMCARMDPTGVRYQIGTTSVVKWYRTVVGSGAFSGVHSRRWCLRVVCVVGGRGDRTTSHAVRTLDGLRIAARGERGAVSGERRAWIAGLRCARGVRRSRKRRKRRRSNESRSSTPAEFFAVLTELC